MAEQLRALLLNHSILTPLCLVLCGFEPHTGHVRQVLLAGVPGVFSQGSSVFAY